MSLFDKLFGGGKKVSKETAETRGEHMPDLKIPIDEKFTIYFKKNGGKGKLKGDYCSKSNKRRGYGVGEELVKVVEFH